MHFATTFPTLAVLATSVATGWVIPNGTTDGIYSVQVFDNGTELHVRLGGPVDIITPPHQPRRTSARFTSAGDTATTDANCGHPENPCSWHLECYTNQGPDFINPGETDRANAGIDQQCGSGARVGHGLDFYSIVGCSVAYACNLGGRSKWAATCTAGERHVTSSLITQTCGQYIPGSATQWRYPLSLRPRSEQKPYQLKLRYGYEAYCTSFGKHFCGRGADDQKVRAR